MDTADTAAVDAFILQRMRQTNLPGVAVAITRGSDVLHVRGYGRDSRGVSVTGDTPFRVASVSKSFTSLAVMQLAELGKVRLDEPVKAALPAFTTADPRSDRITVRQLLNQTSGMADRGFPEVSLPQPQTLHEAVERLRIAKLVAEPGTQWNYHNPNYHVAARLVEVASGEPFAAYLQRHVFGPLGMTRSATTNTDVERVERVPDLAGGHSLAYGRPVTLPWAGYFVNGSGGVVTTASDMARWLAMLSRSGVGLDGTQVLSAAGVRALHTPSAPGGYALGWDTDGPPERLTRIEHGGCCFGWAAHEALLPEAGHGVAILFNSASPVGIDEASVTEGVLAIVSGQSPEESVSSGTVDLALGVLSLAALALGTVGVVRAARWAARQAGRPAWRVAMQLLPHAVPVVLCLIFPLLAGFLFGGRTVTWRSITYTWPALAVFLGAVALAESAVIAGRILHLLRVRPGRHGGALPTPRAPSPSRRPGA